MLAVLHDTVLHRFLQHSGSLLSRLPRVSRNLHAMMTNFTILTISGHVRSFCPVFYKVSLKNHIIVQNDENITVDIISFSFLFNNFYPFIISLTGLLIPFERFNSHLYIFIKEKNTERGLVKWFDNYRYLIYNYLASFLATIRSSRIFFSDRTFTSRSNSPPIELHVVLATFRLHPDQMQDKYLLRTQSRTRVTFQNAP